MSNSLRCRGCQASLSITNSQSLLKLLSIESVMPSNHPILCHPLLLLPSIFPSIRVFSRESVLLIRWPKYWSFNFSISPSNEYSGHFWQATSEGASLPPTPNSAPVRTSLTPWTSLLQCFSTRRSVTGPPYSQTPGFWGLCQLLAILTCLDTLPHHYLAQVVDPVPGTATVVAFLYYFIPGLISDFFSDNKFLLFLSWSFHVVQQ